MKVLKGRFEKDSTNYLANKYIVVNEGKFTYSMFYNNVIKEKAPFAMMGRISKEQIGIILKRVFRAYIKYRGFNVNEVIEEAVKDIKMEGRFSDKVNIYLEYKDPRWIEVFDDKEVIVYKNIVQYNIKNKIMRLDAGIYLLFPIYGKRVVVSKASTEDIERINKEKETIKEIENNEKDAKRINIVLMGRDRKIEFANGEAKARGISTITDCYCNMHLNNVPKKAIRMAYYENSNNFIFIYYYGRRDELLQIEAVKRGLNDHYDGFDGKEKL